VAEAESGLEAIEQAAEHLPDVAIMDIAMKELNGIEASAQMLKRWPQIAVLILSIAMSGTWSARFGRAREDIC